MAFGADAEVVAELTLDSSGASSGAQTAQREIRKIGSDADDVRSGGISRLTGALKALVAIETIRRLAQYTGRLYGLATAAEETASKFVTVFGPAAATLDDRLRALANRAGLTQTEIRGLAATTGSVAQSMGMGQEASAEYAAEIVELAADIASFSNVQGGTERVTQALTSAMLGEREALKSLGLNVKESEVLQRMAERAAEGHTDALTDQGKATATLELITEKAGAAVGDLDRTQDSAANTGRRLGAVTKEEEEQFARLNAVTIRFVQGALAELIDQNRSAGRSFGENLARGIMIGVGALVRGIQTVSNFARALGLLGGTMREMVGSGGEFSLFALGVNSVLGVITSLEKRLLQGTQVIRRFQLARAEMFGSPDDVKRLTKEVYDLGTAIDAAEASLNRMGTTYAGGLFVPSGSFQGEGASANMEAFDALLASLGDLPDVGDLEDVVDETFARVAKATEDGGADLAEAARKAADEAEQARRAARDEAFASRQLEIDAMEEGTERAIHQIRLDAKRRREAFRRAYGELNAEQRRLFATAESAEVDAVVYGAATAVAPETGQDRLARLRAESAETKEQIRGDLEDVAAVTRTVSETVAAGMLEDFRGLASLIYSTADTYTAGISDTVSILTGVFQQAAQDGGQYFEVYKGFAVAQAGIATYESATKAYSSLAGIPIVGPALGAAAAAAAVAAGLANVARIRAMQPNSTSSGGASRGGSYSRGTGSAAAGLNLRTTGPAGAPAPPVNVAAPIVNVAPAAVPEIVVEVDGIEIARANRRGEATLGRRFGSPRR